MTNRCFRWTFSNTHYWARRYNAGLWIVLDIPFTRDFIAVVDDFGNLVEVCRED